VDVISKPSGEFSPEGFCIINNMFFEKHEKAKTRDLVLSNKQEVVINEACKF